MARTLILLTILLTLPTCGKLPLGILGGGGPNVAANTQVGKENNQALVSMREEVTAGRDVVTTQKEVETGEVQELTISNTNIPPWVILLLILGWLLPTPTEIARSTTDFILRLFGRKK